VRDGQPDGEAGLDDGRQPVLSVDENAILVEGDALVGQLPFPALDLSGQLLHRALADRKRAVDAA
jgi:hypothetical protein